MCVSRALERRFGRSPNTAVVFRTKFFTDDSLKWMEYYSSGH